MPKYGVPGISVQKNCDSGLGYILHPGPSNYPLVGSKYHQIRTVRFQLRVVGRSRMFG